MRTNQYGQALPVGIAALLFATVITLTLFNTSQLTSEKMRLTNTADAAVYSGLVWEARALNFQAYMNRAMVANQVSIAQLVSILSWMEAFELTARNISLYTSWVPGINASTKTIHGAIERVNQGIVLFSRATVFGLDKLITGLGLAQTAVHEATKITSQEVIRKVISKNDPRYELSLIGIGELGYHALETWDDFTEKYDSNQQLLRKAAVVEESLDEFSADRSWDMGILDAGIFKVTMKRQGETRLLHKETKTEDIFGRTTDESIEWEWKAKDNLSFYEHHRSIGDWVRDDEWDVNELPLGWGSAFVSTTRNDFDACDEEKGIFRYFFNRCNQWTENRLAETVSDYELEGSRGQKYKQISNGYSGIQSYRELADISEENKFPTLSLSLEVKIDKNKVRTTENIDGIGSPKNGDVPNTGFGPSMFYQEDDFAVNEMAAVSSGEVYFKRPTMRDDGKTEYASLFNPYWDVRLANPWKARLRSWGIRGIGEFFSGGSGSI